MSDFKSVKQLCEENPNLNNHILSLTDIIAKLETDKIDLTKRHIELENSLIELRKYHKEFEQFAATVYDPKKSTYKELETKVAQAEELRKKDIDELWETRITPLQNKVKDQHIQLESVYKRETRLTEEISHLKKVIDRLDTIVNYAAGYISACEQFRDKHPNYVKDWLFSGISGISGYKNDK